MEIGKIGQDMYKEAWDAAWDQAVANSIPFNYSLTQDMADAFKQSYRGDMTDFPAFWDAWQKAWLLGSQAAAQRCIEILDKEKIQDEFGLEQE